MADSTVALQMEGFGPAVDAGATAEERALVEGLRAGQECSYETLIERYEQPVYSIVSRVMDHADDAADVTQEVFLKIFRKIDAFRGESTLKTWIYRIAVNEAHNHRRWFGRHRRQEVALEPEDGRKGVCELVPDRGPSPYEMARDQETHQLLETALKRLSVQYRAALVLREVEGLRYDEIAEILEVSLGTVKSRILRGREALRKVLADQLELSHSRHNGGRAKSLGAAGSGVRPAYARSAVRASSFEPSLLEGSPLEGTTWYER